MKILLDSDRGTVYQIEDHITAEQITRDYPLLVTELLKPERLEKMLIRTGISEDEALRKVTEIIHTIALASCMALTKAESIVGGKQNG